MEWIILWLIAGAVGIAIQIWLKLSLRGVPTNQSMTISPLLGVAMGPITLVLSALRIKPIQDEIKAHRDHQAYHAERQRDGIQRVKAGKAALSRYVQENSQKGKTVLTRRCISVEGFDNPEANTLYMTWKGRQGFFTSLSGGWYLPEDAIGEHGSTTNIEVTVTAKNYGSVSVQLTPTKGKAYLYGEDGNTKVRDVQFALASDSITVGQKYWLPIEFSRSDNAILEDGVTLYDCYIKPVYRAFHIGYYEDDNETESNGLIYGQMNEGERPRLEFVFEMVYSLSPITS